MYMVLCHSLQMEQAPLVKTAAQQFRRMCYNYRDQLTAGIICAGWDKREGGQVYSIPLGGMCVRQPFAIGGVLSTFKWYGVLVSTCFVYEGTVRITVLGLCVYLSV